MKIVLVILVVIFMFGPILVIFGAIFGMGIRKYVEGEEKAKKNTPKSILVGLPFAIILLIILAYLEQCST